MIKQEIIDKIIKYFKLTHFEAEKIYDDIFQGIIKGVKDDNIADITNLGEFIIKYNNNGDNTHKKTVEFLPALSLEEEINQRGFDEHRTFTPSPFTENTQNVKEEIKQEIKQEIRQEVKQDFNPVQENISSELSDSKANVEDEIRKKREEILSKITAPKEETKSTFSAPEIKETVVTPLIVPAVVSTTQEIFNEVKETEPVKETQSFEAPVNEIKEEITEKTPEVEEIHEKSFSDYFTEVKEEKVVSDAVNKTVIPPVENVIPPTAVELHNQITGDQVNKNINYQSTVTPPVQPNGHGIGNGNGNGNGNSSEHVLQDNSYYIWYKDSEPNVSDTQTMSYEYELLYQATKEAEYKSKLRIYVTTFIMFFSVVLLLLILSPVIYKYFFTPGENQQTEEVQQESSTNGVEPKQNEPNNQASVNSLENNNTQNSNAPPVTENNTQQNITQQPVQEQPKQEQPKQEQPKQEQPKQEQPKKEEPVTQPQQNNTPKITGVTKNAMGWMDDKYRVIYVQLDNGKFTIQESAWDSDAKANKRLSVVGGIVPGLKGNVVKVDLGTKGTWYRARFGEFATLEEAKAKAEELRNKENMKLQALLLTFLLYA